jgi:ribosome-interacting GTPase 1
MPANLTPQYYKLEREFKAERDPQEKLRLARELLAIMPKHKGTDKLQAELKAKISRLKEQVESGGARHGAHRTDVHDHIAREGSRQIVLIGPPNAGKSSLLDSLTNARPLVGDFPFTTQEPTAGMMEFETVHFQLIDTPPIAAEHMDTCLPNLVRAADLALLVADVTDPHVEAAIRIVRDRLEEKHIRLCPGRSSEATADPLFACKDTLIAAHKYLEEHGAEVVARLRTACPGFTVVPTSILDDDSLVALKAAVFAALRIIRVYTKRIGHEVEWKDPIILPIGATVEEAARSIHKDFAQKLQFAKIWGPHTYDGQRVKNSYVLADRDVIEFHI